VASMRRGMSLRARNVSAAGTERDRVVAKTWLRSSWEILSITLSPLIPENSRNNYATTER
jgi:hypothetical protein